MRLNTFNDVVVAYDTTKPVNGRRTPKRLDVRPIGDRKYKEERVCKIGDDCYVLSDGVYDWGNVWDITDARRTPDELVKLCPIVWRRDGERETVTIINTLRGDCTTKRKEFLWNYLPRGLVFRVTTTNEHFINDLFLPRAEKLYADKVLTFERTGDNTWKHIGETYYPTRQRVQKSEKKQSKEAIDGFYDWIQLMAPILRDAEDDRKATTAKVIDEFRKTYTNKPLKVMTMFRDQGYNQWYASQKGPIEGLPVSTDEQQFAWFRNILVDEEHSVRVEFAKMVLDRIRFYEVEGMSREREERRWKYNIEFQRHDHVLVTLPPLSPEEIAVEVKKMRSRYVYLINRVCGFVKEKEIK